jgi:hypothetical protein
MSDLRCHNNHRTLGSHSTMGHNTKHTILKGPVQVTAIRSVNKRGTVTTRHVAMPQTPKSKRWLDTKSPQTPQKRRRENTDEYPMFEEYDSVQMQPLDEEASNTKVGRLWKVGVLCWLIKHSEPTWPIREWATWRESWLGIMFGREAPPGNCGSCNVKPGQWQCLECQSGTSTCTNNCPTTECGTRGAQRHSG